MLLEAIRTGRIYPRYLRYYGIMKCPVCGGYHHFLVAEDQHQSKGNRFIGLTAKKNRKELLLVCDSCRRTFEFPLGELYRPEAGLDYETTSAVWSHLQEAVRHKILEDPSFLYGEDPDEEETGLQGENRDEEDSEEEDGEDPGEFLIRLMEETRETFGPNRAYGRVFRTFYDWFCEEYRIPLDLEEGSEENGFSFDIQ